MRQSRRLPLGVLVALAALSATRGSTRAAMDEAEKARRAAVVAKIGDKTVTAGELEDRLSAIPRFQLAGFGATPDAVRKKFLEDVILPEVLLAKGAEDAKLGTDDPVTEHQLLRALSNATLHATREKLGRAQDISMDDVKTYYDANRSHYDTPERIAIWRILCRSREEGVAVLEAARKDATPQKFMELARDHSIDKATNMRGGNLGFLAPDGTSNEAGLKADPVLVKAAQALKDGELVAAPVPEGPYFAVVWRRGTVSPVLRTVDDVKEQIRDTLFKQRIEEANKKLLDELRDRELKDFSPELVNGIEISPVDGEIVARKRPGQVPPIGQIGTGKAPPPAPPSSR
jgi:peptidyl-prolyl cis-trans isomerase C